MDASKGYIKDGNKNRLREQDIHKIVDAFNRQWEIDKFCRLVPYNEIEKNEYNLNIPRYIDTQEEEDIQDLNAHLNGGIPQKDIDALQEFWTVYPNLRKDLFTPIREGYAKLNVEKSAIKSTIFEHSDFMQYDTQLNGLFEDFKNVNHAKMNAISSDTKPKDFIKTISEDILERYGNKPLIGQYDIYQHLLDYWNETLKDDVYLIVEDGWVAKVKRILEKNKKGTEVDKGWTCDLLPKELVINRFLASEYQELVSIENELETIQAEIVAFEEEHAGDEGILSDATNDKGSITKTTLTAFIKENKSNQAEKETILLANAMLKLFNREAELKKDQKEKTVALDNLTLKTFKELTENDVRTLVVDDKWLTSIKASIQTEIDAISQRLTGRVKQFSERYENTLIELDKETKTLEDKVSAHLEKMGLVWS